MRSGALVFIPISKDGGGDLSFFRSGPIEFVMDMAWAVKLGPFLYSGGSRELCFSLQKLGRAARLIVESSAELERLLQQ